jgi:hypothetical protein
VEKSLELVALGVMFIKIQKTSFAVIRVRKNIKKITKLENVM